MPNPPNKRPPLAPAVKPPASRMAASREAGDATNRGTRQERTREFTKNSVNPEFLERYQIELQKNPRSRVFAPLAEAYRKMGLVQEAIRICKFGITANPEFAGGLVAFSKALIETKNFEDALTQLQKATQLSPDNLLAHMLMGEVLLELRRPKDALKAFKMVLFLNPDDDKAKATVQKWEFLTADEFDEEEFAMRPVFAHQETTPPPAQETTPPPAQETTPPPAQETTPPPAHTLVAPLLDSPQNPAAASGSNFERRRAQEINRAVSLADAFTIRNDLAAAIETLERAAQTLGPAPDIQNRLKMLARRTQVIALEAEAAHDLELEPQLEPEQEEPSAAVTEHTVMDRTVIDRTVVTRTIPDRNTIATGTGFQFGRTLTPTISREGTRTSHGLQARIDQAVRPETVTGTRLRAFQRDREQRIILLEGLLHRISERRQAV